MSLVYLLLCCGSVFFLGLFRRSLSLHSSLIGIFCNWIIYFRRLKESDIRLLNVIPRENGTAVYELTRCPRESAPPYDAVTYTWGEDQSMTWIVCNKFPLSIRSNLYKALLHLDQSRPLPRRPLWIDGICLNQNDAVEKAMHVPLMDKIYANATRTLVWLGQAADDSDLAMEKLPSLTLELMTLCDAGQFEYTPANQDSLLAHGLPAANNPIWNAMKALFSRPWFRRLWTLQEIVLSKEPILLCGTKSARWEDLPLLNRAATTLGLGVLFLPNDNPESPMEGPSAFVNHIYHMRERERIFAAMDIPPEWRPYLPTGLDLPSAVRFSMYREYKEKVDRFWAILGLLDHGIRKSLQDEKLIDYSPTARTDYHKSFLGVMRVQVKHDPYLAMQLLANGLAQAKHQDLPSWCADWSATQMYTPLSNMVGVAAGRPDGLAASDGPINHHRTLFQPIMTLGSCDSLNVLGMPVETVQEVSCDVGKFWVSYRGHNGSHDQARLSQASTWAADCIEIIKGEMDTTTRRAFVADLNKLASAAFDAAVCAVRQDELDDSQRRIKAVIFPNNSKPYRALFVLWCNGRKFFRTKEMSFGLGPPNLQKGDLISVLFGGTPLFALRPVGRQSLGTDASGTSQSHTEEKFRVIGDAYIPSLMHGEIFQGRSCEDMRNFKLV